LSQVHRQQHVRSALLATGFQCAQLVPTQIPVSMDFDRTSWAPGVPCSSVK
jgi:hypothetical protein